MLPENSGRIVRQTGPDTSDVVVSELPYPVNIGFDADGQLIIGGPAFGSDDGVGQGFLVRMVGARGSRRHFPDIRDRARRGWQKGRQPFSGGGAVGRSAAVAAGWIAGCRDVTAANDGPLSSKTEGPVRVTVFAARRW